ncbi:Zn-ribbon domain-containing OB-fold protein [Nocardia sp.]|uniref:Zn-ribbon domain-containing OB-fold protein n=1 Tax=Nocardia sp. TaxID=1821 RepID=UPI00261A407D|nr:OB-fold domain-containing protein [Nocardia sp.]
MEWDAHDAAGTGTVCSWIVSRHPSQPDADARIVAVIELVEGARIVTNLQEIDPAQVVDGMAVEVTFDELGGVKLPQFRPIAK